MSDYWDFDVSAVETPSFVCNVGALRRNLEILAGVQDRAGCKILLALKGFAMWSVFPIVREYLTGVTASSPHEARLGAEELGGEVHAYAPAYSDAEFTDILRYADHVVLNSPSQWRRLRPLSTPLSTPLSASAPAGEARSVEFGLRVNPQHSEVEVAIYDPCAPRSRLGTIASQLRDGDLDGMSGLHFHTLCELGSDALERTVDAVERGFGGYLADPAIKWLNMGGGHHITRPGYDIDRLVRVVSRIRDKYDVQVYLEPGEAIAINTGVLVASVLDLVQNDVDIAVLDTSATAHMPDVLEMPYRPVIVGAGAPGQHPHTYRLGGLTCLAGDVIGDYSFPRPLRVGDVLVFLDMAHYTMVKTTTFNGVRLPNIAIHDPDTGHTRVVRRFGYEDYKARLS